MSANIRSLFEDTPRPGPLPTFPFPNDHPFAIRWKDSPGVPVPVGVGPLSTYQEHIKIPIPGEAGAPPPWTPVSPSREGPSTPCLASYADCTDSFPPDSSSPPPAPCQVPTKTYISRKGKGLAPLLPPAPEMTEVNWLQSAPNFPTASRRNLREQRCGRLQKRFCKCKFCDVSGTT